MGDLAKFITEVKELRPKAAVILGSGQSSILDSLREIASLSFVNVPDLPPPTVAGHSGRIVAGTLNGTPLLVFQGRVHRYEGHSWDKVSAPVRFVASLGIKTLLLTNAAGGIHPSLEPGTMMIVRDHLFWQSPGAWKGPGPIECGCLAGIRPSSYSSRLSNLLQSCGQKLGEALYSGIYAAVTGPSYETPAEIRAMQKCAADAVGMSTAHEIETGKTLGLECAAISGITNRAAGLTEAVLNHRDVLKVMSQLRERLAMVIAEFVRLLHSRG